MTYIFDGSYYGFLSSIYDAFERKEQAQLLYTKESYVPTMFEDSHTVITQSDKALRVLKGLEKNIGKEKTYNFYKSILSEDPKAWSAALRIAIAIFKGETKILDNYGHPDVIYLDQILHKVNRERHRMKAFIRFSKSADGSFFAVIDPDFNVLPLIISFFKNRYTDQAWLIYDTKRNYGVQYDTQSIKEVQLLAENDSTQILPTTTVDLDERDELFQRLWKQYFKSTNIVERKNMKLHLQHVPKRYWKYLVEKQ